MKTGKFTKLLALLIVLSMMLCMMSACGSSTSDTAETQSATAAASVDTDNEALSDVDAAGESVVMDSIVIYEKGNNSLAPWGTRNGLTGTFEVYEMLYTLSVDGEMYSQLADVTRGEYGGYDHEAGTGVYDFYIYDYIYDHAGNHVTASDVAFSFTYQYENEETSGWETFVSAEAVDDTTCRFTFSRELTGLGEFENIFCRQFIVTEAAFNADGSAFANAMCGTGPYKFVSYESGVSYTIEINEDYWQKEELRRQESAQNVKTITYYFQDEESQRVIGLETGTLDMGLVSASSLEPFMEGGEYADQFQVYSYLSKLNVFMMANCDSTSACSDLNLRLAVYSSIDRNGLCIALGLGYEPAVMMGSAYYSDYSYVDWASMDNYNTQESVDSDKVQEYLTAAGYNGETLKLMAPSDKSTACEVIVNMLAAQGINVELSLQDQSTFNALAADPTAWDLIINTMAGDNIATVWQHGFDVGNTTNGLAANFADDPEWQELLETCYGSAESHTPEALEAWWQHAIDNGYCMGLFNNYEYCVIPANVTYVQMGDKQSILPGGFIYSE